MEIVRPIPIIELNEKVAHNASNRVEPDTLTVVKKTSPADTSPSTTESLKAVESSAVEVALADNENTGPSLNQKEY
jgi:hypothetical protein